MFIVLPAMLLGVSILLSVNICVACIIGSGLFRKKHPPVRPVDMRLVLLHLVSVIAGVCAFPVYRSAADAMSPAQRSFYEGAAWPAASVCFALVVAQLVLMYIQANRAMRAQSQQPSPSNQQ